MEKKTHMLHKAFIQELMHGNLGLHAPSRINCLFHREGTPFKQPAERYLHGWTKITNAAWHCHALPTLKNISPHPGICAYGIHMIPYYVVPIINHPEDQMGSANHFQMVGLLLDVAHCGVNNFLTANRLSQSTSHLTSHALQHPTALDQECRSAKNDHTMWSTIVLETKRRLKKQQCEEITSWNFQNKLHKQKYIKYHQIHVTWGSDPSFLSTVKYITPINYIYIVICVLL